MPPRSDRVQLAYNVAFALSWALIFALAPGLGGCGLPTLAANGAAAVIAEAQRLRHEDRADQAAAVITRQLLTKSPGNVELQGELARDVVFTDPGRALDLVGQAFDPTKPDAKLMMVGGIANDLLGQHAEAQKLYRDGLKISPNDASLKTNLDISIKLAANEHPTGHILDICQPCALANAKKVREARASRRQIAEPVKRPVPVVVTVPPPTFRERWRIL